MKNIFKISVLMFSLFIMSCEEEEDFSPQYSDISWFTGQQGVATFNLSVNNYLTFMDLSQNALSHKWVITDSSYFLTPEFTEKDSVYDKFIIPNAGLESESSDVHVLFSKPGQQTVQLYNTFEDSVAWFSLDTDTLYAEQIDGLWVIDTTFVVDVFADLAPAFKVYADDVEVLSVSEDDMPSLADTASWPMVNVEVGGTLKYESVSTTGRPTGTTWTLTSGDVSEEKRGNEVTFLYTKLGEYYAGEMTSNRSGDFMPSANASKIIPLKIKGIPSSQPFVYSGNLVENGDGAITFSVSGEVTENSVKGTAGNFTVHVKNGAFDQDIDVLDVTLDPNDMTSIVLALTAPIYNTDTVKVSYDGLGSIQSVDTRELEAFGPESLAPSFEAGVLPDYFSGFETFKDNVKNAYCEGYFVGNNNVPFAWWNRVEDITHSGLAAMKFESPATGMDGNNIILQGTNVRDKVLPAQAYRACVWVYIPTGTTLTTLSLKSAKYGGTPIVEAVDIASVPRNTWTQLCIDISFDLDTDNQTRLDYVFTPGLNPADAVTQTVYLDDWNLIPLETRP
ncbi:hypothetical protein N7E81_12135 [Reichenbachiella carrageenanivorans]|uniref:Carbohydrate binding domain-containing protein n=1 Tax=Reichenbachiella carrageenanivorans TaxID=2979869 RepID=A0ABY6CW23_9BACT|nr:hypothetical protein [Reichenbachiella carrageenanivorans]UXX78107.1 hypothetical protein N7E81_12135 [Reichenbachiella carrageenanivorans]